MARSPRTRLLTTGILIVTVCTVLAGITPGSATVSGRWENATAPVVVAKPNGGQRIDPGTTYTIRWFAREMDTVRIEYSTDEGVTWLLIDAAVPANAGDGMRCPETASSRHYSPLPPAGSYVWDVPHTEHNNVLLRVSDKDHPERVDINDAPFAIRPSVLSGWTAQSVGAAVTLRSVSVVDDSVAWTAGLGGVVFRTTTGGTSWMQVQNVPIEGEHISGTRGSSAFVCASLTNDGRVYRTTDGGASWNIVLQYTGSGARVKSLYMFDPDSGVALGDPVGGFWSVFKTTDAGSTWDTLARIPQQLSESGYREAFTWVGTRNGWFGSENGRVYRTTDEGQTWSHAVTAAGFDVFGLAFISKDIGLASTAFLNIYRTTDAGSSWSHVSTVPGTPMNLFACLATASVPSPRWWATNMDEIYRTTDQGSTWTYETVLDGIPFNDLEMKYVQEAGVVVGYAAGAAGGALMRYVETVTTLEPVFSVAPSSLLFGDVTVGDSLYDTVKVKNTGNASLNITAAGITGSTDFTIFGTTPVTLAPSDSALFAVRFGPTTIGAITGTLTFTHSAAGSPTGVALSGTGVPVGPSPKFLTVVPETIIAKDPTKAKFWKPVKKFKGLNPNWANLLDETVAQGGFQPGASESDSAGGMVVGISHMYLKDPFRNKWAVIKDSAAIRPWIRLTKWDFKKSIGKSFNALQKTLETKAGKHDLMPARGFDFTTDGKNKPLVKQMTKLDPKKQDNALFGEMVALKLNIAASALGKTPTGFGDLLFDRNTSSYDEQSVLQISASIDQMMTYWQLYDSSDFADAYTTVYDINRAFVGPFDTASFNVGGLVLEGAIELSTVSYLKAPTPFIATRLEPTTTEYESLEDFELDDEEFEEGLLPVAVKLYQNYPNPFNPGTTLSFRLLESSQVTIRIYDMLGQVVATLLTGEEMEEGYNEVRFNAESLSSGVYFCRIDVHGVGDAALHSALVNKMVLLK